MISVYADGSSTGKANREGGWAFVITKDNQPIFANYGGNKHTTNNVMELTAAIEGLRAVLANGWHIGNVVELVSDSQYTLGIATGGYHPQKNIEICQELTALFKKANARARWVRGHAGDQWNERCDSLAKQGKEEALLPRADKPLG